MKFPTTDDFLEAFGLEPIEVDSSTAYCRYVKSSRDRQMEIDLSFSAVSGSFQVVLRCNQREVVTISSESTKLVEIVKENTEQGVRAVFDLHGATSEALVVLEPDVSCRWWTLNA
jgi:hypothetical protein